MTTEQQTLAEIRATIEQLPKYLQAEIERHASVFRHMIKTDGNSRYKRIAFTLVGAEMAAEE